MKSFRLFSIEEAAAPDPDVQDLVHRLEGKCTHCRLGMLPANKDVPGFFFRGRFTAEVAAVADYPLPVDLLTSMFLGHPAGDEFQKWILRTGLDLRNVLSTYLVQCKPPEVVSKDGRKAHRPPLPDEIENCFFTRTLPVLRAMPNLEVVLALGHQAAKTLLGSKQLFKHLRGNWFGTDLLPGVAVFCLPHPREVDKKDSPAERGLVRQLLEFFSNEYVSEKKVLRLLQQAELRRKEERQKYVL